MKIGKDMIKREKIIITIILIVQTIIFVVAGLNKSYIHMDEAYSLGLSSYNKTEIQENNDFYNTWHNKDYYEDYLCINKNEINSFSQVYENQKNDVHPPLYYILLRIALGFNIGSYSKWAGIILNIIIYIFITIYVYLIIKKLLKGSNKCEEKSAILALVSSLTLSSINNAIYIRMYALSTLNIAITTYLHLKLLDKKENNYKSYLAIGVLALVGSLTHYYYLFYLAMLFILFVIKYIKEKNYKELGKYIGAIVIAGITSLLIFPYSIQHMFFGYRGQGALNNLINPSKFISSIVQYLILINVYVFNNVLFILLIFIFGMYILKKKKKKIKVNVNSNKYIKYIALPTFCYFMLVSISSPWIELRYIMPICNLIFILVIYYIAVLIKDFVEEKTLNKIIIVIFLVIFIMPFISNTIMNLVLGKNFRSEKEYTYSNKTEIVEILKGEINLPIQIINILSNSINVPIDNILLFLKDFKLEPEVSYSNKKEITKIIKSNSNLPTLYLFNSNTNRFLDDILLFANINESYIAKDIKCNEENIKNIMKYKDISKGMLLFINDGQESDKLANSIKNAMKFKNITYLKRLNACDVYLIN